MKEYFVPKEIRWLLINELKQIEFDLDLDKTAMEFDSSDMDLEKQVVHAILKLKIGLKRQDYNNLKKQCRELRCCLNNDSENISIADNLDNLFKSLVEDRIITEDLTYKELGGAGFKENADQLRKIKRIE